MNKDTFKTIEMLMCGPFEVIQSTDYQDMQYIDVCIGDTVLKRYLIQDYDTARHHFIDVCNALDDLCETLELDR